MDYKHKQLAEGRWKELSFVEQLANVGSEIERTIKWRKKNEEYSKAAFERALELLDLTIVANVGNSARLKELVRTREALADHFVFDNEYQSTDEIWQKYFFAFNYAARLGK